MLIRLLEMRFAAAKSLHSVSWCQRFSETIWWRGTKRERHGTNPAGTVLRREKWRVKNDECENRKSVVRRRVELRAVFGPSEGLPLKEKPGSLGGATRAGFTA
jgi:hypothetical protein